MSNDWQNINNWAKHITLAIMHLVTLGLVAAFMMEWGTGYSSIFLGLLMFLLSCMYTWGFSHSERPRNGVMAKPTLDNAFDENKSMQYLLTKQLCTIPLLTYVVVIDMNNNVTDFLVIAIVLLGLILFLGMILLEQRMIVADKNANSYNFKTEKLAYLLIVFIASLTFFYILAFCGDFWKYAHSAHASNASASAMFKLFFSILLAESTICLFVYAIDEVQTFKVSFPIQCAVVKIY